MKNKEYYKQCTVVAKALAHPHRLLIVDELSRKDLCVSDLIKLLRIDQTTVSKHLLVLRNARLIESEKKGLYVIYHLKTPCITKFFCCLESAIKESGRSLS